MQEGIRLQVGAYVFLFFFFRLSNIYTAWTAVMLICHVYHILSGAFTSPQLGFVSCR